MCQRKKIKEYNAWIQCVKVRKKQRLSTYDIRFALHLERDHDEIVVTCSQLYTIKVKKDIYKTENNT